MEDWTISFHSFRIKKATFVEFCLLRPFSQEIAETKSQQINRFSKENGHPLKTDIEELTKD